MGLYGAQARVQSELSGLLMKRASGASLPQYSESEER